MLRFKTAIAICIFFISLKAMAVPASTYVEISDRAYQDIERLAAFELCRPPMIDQRPFLRGEFARIIAEARKNAEALPKISSGDGGFEDVSSEISRRHAIERTIARLTEEFHEELADIGAIEGGIPLIRGHPFEELRLDATWLSEAPLRILTDNGVATVWAFVNPLYDYREGRHAIDGFQTAAEATMRFRITNYLALFARPRFEANTWKNGNDMEFKPLFQEGYALAQVQDAAFTIGRSSVVFGPGERGALLITNNARPLDIIKFSTPSPFRLPWVLRHLGEWQATLFGANLGPDQPRKYDWLTGYRLTYRPVKYLELAFGNTTMMGGEGSPDLSALDIFAEFWGFRAAGTSPNSPNKTNHLMEASALVRIPKLWGLQIYGVLNNEDKRDTLKRFFRDGSSYLAGLYLPAMGNTGSQALRLEFRRMSALAYRHGLFSNGYTLNNLFIGDDLGPDALGFRAKYDYDFSDVLNVAASFDWELRRGDIHLNQIEPDGTLGDLVVVSSSPHENRYRFIVEPRFWFRKNLKIYAMAGYERVLNAGYVSGASRNNWLTAVSLRIDLDPHFGFEVK